MRERVSAVKRVSQQKSELSGAREQGDQMSKRGEQTDEQMAQYIHPYSLLFETSVERFFGKPL